MAKRIRWTVEYADAQIAKWVKIKEVILRSEVRDDDDLNVKVYKLYLKHTSVAEVAKILAGEGVRVDDGRRKISSNDISGIIREQEIDDSELQELVRNIHRNATMIMDKYYN